MLAAIERSLETSQIVLLLGPRQCGKTTLARQLAATHAATLAQPMTALEKLRGWVIIDEAQLLPELFPVLRVLSDRRPRRTRFLLLGSASMGLTTKISESLAGRIAFLNMAGFDVTGVGTAAMGKLWWRGGLPRSVLARSDAESTSWRTAFIQTFLERDLRRFGIQIPPPALRRLWVMLAHYHGRIWNASEIGRSLGEAHTTVRRHLDVLTGALVVRQLPPWFENIGKRQIKAPKVFVRDSGLLHSLLGIHSARALESHPKLGASWEGSACEEVLRLLGDRDAYFWATQGGAALDLMVTVRGKRLGFEFKYSDAPTMTRSLQVAYGDLGLKRAWIVYPGSKAYPVASWADVVPLAGIAERLFRVRLL